MHPLAILRYGYGMGRSMALRHRFTWCQVWPQPPLCIHEHSTLLDLVWARRVELSSRPTTRVSRRTRMRFGSVPIFQAAPPVASRERRNGCSCRSRAECRAGSVQFGEPLSGAICARSAWRAVKRACRKYGHNGRVLPAYRFINSVTAPKGRQSRPSHPSSRCDLLVISAACS